MITKFLQYSIGKFLFWKQDLWLSNIDLQSHLEQLAKKEGELTDREVRQKKLAESYSVKQANFYNSYNEECSTNVFTFKNLDNTNSEKHLVIFWGGGTSIEGMLSEIHGLVSNTDLTIHTFNYPFVNDTKGASYSHDDLVTCSRAVLDQLAIPLDKTVLYGDCYGAAVAETTFQKLKSENRKPAGRILSNSFTHFTDAAHNLIFCNMRMALFADPTSKTSFIVTLSIYIILLPLLIPVHILLMCLPLLGWSPRPADTALEQSSELWVTNRASDTVLASATLNKVVMPCSTMGWKDTNSLLHLNADENRRQRFGHQPHFADLSDLSVNGEEGLNMYHLVERFAQEACRPNTG